MVHIGSLPPDQLSPEQKAWHDEMVAFTGRTLPPNIKTQDPASGRLLGPFGPLEVMPSVGRAFFDLNRAITSIPGLPADAREVAILVTGSHHEAGYEVYAHSIIGVRMGLQQAQVQRIVDSRGNEKPEGLGAAGDVAFDVANELVIQRGPLKAELWQRAVDVLGKDGATALVNYVAFYAFVSVFLNGFDVGVPEGGVASL